MLSWFCPCIIFNYYQTSFLDHISLIPSKIIETEMNFDINILIHYGSSLLKHPCKNLVSIFEMKLMSGELSIMSFNVNFIRFHMKNVSLFAASLDFISFEALVYFFFGGDIHWFQILPCLPEVSETYMMPNYKNYFSSQCIWLFLYFMNLILFY